MRYINLRLTYLLTGVDVLQVAMKHPAAVTACNVDLENLITDSNRSIATLAITTLLKVTATFHFPISSLFFQKCLLICSSS